MNTLKPGDEGAAAFAPLLIETPGQNTSFHTSEVLDARFAINASNIEELFYDMVCLFQLLTLMLVRRFLWVCISCSRSCFSIRVAIG